MKERYIELMARVLSAYSEEHINRYFQDVKEHGLTEHGFPRLTANIGILIAHGKKTEYLSLFCEMMDFCCQNIPKVRKAGNEFSVKEIIFCIMELEEKQVLPAQKIAEWKSLLGTIDPYENYKHYAKSPEEEKHNWCCFALVSEYMREYIGVADTEKEVAIQIPTQLRRFDENGMYRDPNEPMVYDLVTRGLFAILLHFGYHGEFFDEINENLRRSGLLTLEMQSVTGEIPYGGRSAQFLNNEPHMAVVLEYEASRYAKEGNLQMAARFKQGVNLALENLEFWLARKPMRHIKNYFPLETSYGCDGYGYFDKYMITVASFLYAAYLICDEEIPIATEPMPSVAMQTSKYFHKVFLRAGDYFAEIETDANRHYDASGLGRVHKKGAPSTICMSMPATSTPKYTVDREDLFDCSLCPGIKQNGKWSYGCEEGVSCEALELSHTDAEAHALLQYDFLGEGVVKVDYDVDESGVLISVHGEKELAHLLPAFCFDGTDHPEITYDSNTLTVEYQGWICRYTTNGKICDLGKIACNRNGHYRIFSAVGEKELTVKIQIEKM